MTIGDDDEASRLEPVAVHRPPADHFHWAQEEEPAQPDPASARRRRYFLWWAIPLVLLIAAAASVKLLSEVRGEPEGLESAASWLGIAAAIYAAGSPMLFVLGTIVWTPIEHAFRLHRGPCPWCGLTIDPRDPYCRFCRGAIDGDED